MTRRVKRGLLAGIAVAVLVPAGAAVAGTAGGDDDAGEKAITGPALERASAAALESTGGGRVTATEVEDEEGAYEVEVTREDGSQVDVHLDERFGVLGAQEDGDDGVADSD